MTSGILSCMAYIVFIPYVYVKYFLTLTLPGPSAGVGGSLTVTIA